MTDANRQFTSAGSALEPEMRELLHIMENAAITAGRLILSKLGSKVALTSWRKEDDTVVTDADLASQALLIEALRGCFPLVCEEDPSSHALVETLEDYILIDPLDGTTSARRFGALEGGQVGFGPLLGLVRGGRLQASIFVSLPLRCGFLAVKGFGCERFSMREGEDERAPLSAVVDVPIEKAAMLFYAGKNGELEALANLRMKTPLENYYRFGGFANDAVRIALNYEQLQLQFAVKAWDLPAALIPSEVGCQVLLDPCGQAIELSSYKPRLENPILIGRPKLVAAVLPLLKSHEQ